MSEKYSNSFLNNSSNITPSTQKFLKSIRYEPLGENDDNFSFTLLPITVENESISILHAISNSLDTLSKSDQISIILDNFSRYLKKGKMIKAGSCLEEFLSEFSDLIKINCEPGSNATLTFKNAKKMFNQSLLICNELIETISSKVAHSAQEPFNPTELSSTQECPNTPLLPHTTEGRFNAPERHHTSKPLNTEHLSTAQPLITQEHIDTPLEHSTEEQLDTPEQPVPQPVDDSVRPNTLQPLETTQPLVTPPSINPTYSLGTSGHHSTAQGIDSPHRLTAPSCHKTVDRLNIGLCTPQLLIAEGRQKTIKRLNTILRHNTSERIRNSDRTAGPRSSAKGPSSAEPLLTGQHKRLTTAGGMNTIECLKNDNIITILIKSYEQTVKQWLNTLIISILQIMNESRQGDVVSTSIRMLMSYCRTSHQFCVAIIAAGGIDCLVSICYSLSPIAYDAIKLCVLLAINCPFAIEIFIKSGIIECAGAVFAYKADDYTESVRMEMAIAISALTLPDFTRKLSSGKPRLSGNNDKLIPVVITGLVDMCKNTSMNDILMTCVSALANLVMYEPSAVYFVVEANALPVIVGICMNGPLGNNFFVKDWVANLVALVSNHDCYHRHMLDCGCLELLMTYLLEPPPSLRLQTHINALSRVLQKTIIALTKLTLVRGVSAIIVKHKGLERMQHLVVNSNSRYGCEYVRLAAINGLDFIQTRLRIDESCADVSQTVVFESSVMSKKEDDSPML